MRRTIDAGVAGCSIEDKDQGSGGLYPLDEALQRFSAAREVVAEVGVGFRADRPLRGLSRASITIRSARPFDGSRRMRRQERMWSTRRA